MIVRTFQHIPGVGPWREKDLWARGIGTWNDFPPEGAPPGLSSKLDARARERIDEARQALERRDLEALAALIPSREHWRLYPAFSDEVCCFDIEADGVSDARPTVVSVFDRFGCEVFIEGRNLHALPAALARSRIWATFNGSCYDVPVLKNTFPELATPLVHLDLRFLCRRVRLKGGLKQVEDSLGLARPLHLRGVNGWDAVVLWRAYQRSANLEALRYLVEYNLYDSINLRSLLDVVYNRAAEQLSCEVPLRPVFERGEVLYDVSKLLLALGPSPRDHRLLQRLREQDRQLS